MSIESVREFLAQRAPDVAVIDLDRPSETSWLSAAFRVEPAQIAKSLVLAVAGRHNVMLMACGDARVDNTKAKSVFGGKVRFVAAEEAAVLTGHVPGGMCPFGLISPFPIYCDLQLKRFDVVVTGGGATHCAVIIDPLRMAAITGADWIDVCEKRTRGRYV
jgi:prolyl-tRNA editing enzyme YbaK/EbsC (Cys-tRNA(Pro) deacylase)